MKARPILFSAPMVLALLDGRKTQTRRIVKPRGRASLFDVEEDGSPMWTDDYILDPGNAEWRMRDCPYGTAGDVLWVRESCRAEELSRPQQTRPATAREQQVYARTTVIELDELDGSDGVRYAADDQWRKIENTAAAGDAWIDLFHYRGRGKGRIGNPVPSIHMPRWASRLTLQITDVRVERLQDISEGDAIAEGMTFPEGMKWGNDAVSAYRELWRQLNGDGSWDANPWVWAISFKVHQQNVDAFMAAQEAA